MYKLEIILKNGVTFVDSFETEAESAAAVKQFCSAINDDKPFSYTNLTNGLIRIINPHHISSILVYKEG